MQYKNQTESKIKNIKRKAVLLTAFFLALTLTVFSVTAINLSANATNSYSPRYQPPASSNQYYFSDKNVFYKYGYGMPNCTAYAYGRAYEILNKAPTLSPNNAQRWYDYNKTNQYYPYGQTPKIGAIACWDSSSGGHVAVVEAVVDGKIIFSNSGYGYYNFYLTTANVTDKNPGQSNWTFQGYIYLGNYTQSSTVFNGDLYMATADDGLNLRADAGLSYTTLKYLPYGTGFVVTKTKTADGIMWGYTTYEGQAGWCSLGYAKLLLAKPAEPKPTQPQPPEISNVVTSMYGDMNGDNEVSVVDVTILQKILAGKIIPSPSQTIYADMDRNGDVSVVDVTAIQKYLAE